MYEIALEAYKGPLDKLLELVEGKELEITQISLAAVTADFLKYVEDLGKAPSLVDPTLLADFLVVASKLILIKSKTLLSTIPLTEEEASDIKDLELRLKLYQELKRPQEHLRSIWHLYPQSATREFLRGVGPVFYPPRGLKSSDLENSLKHLLMVLEKTLKPVQTVRIEVINLKKKIEEIFKRVGDAPMSLHQFKNSGTKSELVVMFLAILHLIKEQLVFVDQSNHFEDIMIVKKGSET